MNKLKVLSVSSLALLCNMIPTYAATNVNIVTKATTMNVTVPSSIEFIFNEDGSTTLPTNFDITNNSEIARVSLVGANMDAESSGWRLLPASADTKSLAANTKDIQFYMQDKLVSPGDSASGQGSVEWTNGELTIAPQDIQNIEFNVNRGAFTTPEASTKAFSMTLSFEFNQ